VIKLRGRVLRRGEPVLITIPSLRMSGVAHRYHATASLQISEQHRTVDKIQLDVLVSDAGYVTRAMVRRGDTSEVGLDRAALQAAMAARFRPATRDGVPGSMWTRLSFDFKN
jgi:TonB family protein